MYHAVAANYRHLDENKEDFGFFINLGANEDYYEVSIRIAFRVLCKERKELHPSQISDFHTEGRIDICFIHSFSLPLQEESSWTVCRLLPRGSMRKVRATQSIPLVNVQGVGDGRVDVEENNRPVQTR